MNILSLTAFTGSVACMATGIYVFCRNRGSRSHLLFFLICASLSLLNMFYLPAYSSGDRDGIIFWTEFASVCVNLFYAFNLHFYIDLNIKRKLRAWQTALLYAPGIIIITVFALSPLSVLDYVLYEGIWRLVPAYGNPWFYIASGYGTAYSCAALVMIIVFMHKAETIKEKKQGKWLLFNFALSTATGAAAMWIIPYFNYRIPNIGPVYHLLYAAGLIYSVIRFRMMEFNPSIVAQEIISHIDDMVFLLTPGLKIISANRKSCQVLASGNGIPAGTPVESILMDRLFPDDVFLKLSEGSVERINLVLTFTADTGSVITDTYISRVKDRFGDIIGYLVISRENRGRIEFQKRYRVTDREMEITDLTLSGLSSREIGEKLGISDRTVQSHQEHIYQKLGVAGKVELIQIAHEYNIPVMKNFL